MCGIAGVISNNERTVRESLPRMLNKLVHRGPDDYGEEITNTGKAIVGLGHRRLSILDLSDAGHQPMIDPLTGAQIIFNGEIYNFQRIGRELEKEGIAFRGHSDTEVLLQALIKWGTDIFARLEGMYALAFFDPRKNKLILARDPLGIKPLYMSLFKGGIVFASEIRAIIASGLIPRLPDKRGLAGFLAYGSIQEPLTFFEDIKAFPPGCWQEFSVDDLSNLNRSKPNRFWDFPPLQSDISLDEAVYNIRDLLDMSVHDHLVSDVPIGIFLSSGLDSTAIAGIASRHKSDVCTFTIGFTDNPDMSEAKLACETAKMFGTKHTEVDITCVEAEETAFSWLKSMDQPSVDGLNTYIISKAARNHGLVVALSGLGGDELFGGYHNSFYRVPRIEKVLRKFSWVPKWMWSLIARLVTIGQAEAVVQKAVDLLKADANLPDLYLHFRRNVSNKYLAALGVNVESLNLGSNLMPPEILKNINISEDDPIGAISQLESRFYMKNTLLRDSDNNGMANSIEIRVPFLDRRVLDAVFAMPGRVKLPTGKADKYLMRQAFDFLFRDALLKQKKRGFTLPTNRWMVGPMRNMCEDSLDYLKSTDIFCPGGIDKVWKSFLKEPLKGTRAFGLCVLGFYLKTNT